MDFAALPPEINSGLMYTGPGSGPMLAAAAAWDVLATELYSTASSYGSVIADLASGWLGPSSVAMAAAATPYVSWITTTAGQVEATGMQAKAAAAAFEAAFAMTVPPPVIAANRALLMLLIATNFFGQNTPAIMATEAQYLEMWAQDAAAMYGYQAAAQVASTFTPFTPPQQNTNPGGVGAQGAAVGQAAATPAGTVAQTVAAVPTQVVPAAAVLPNGMSAASLTSSSTAPLSTAQLSSVTGLSSSSAALTSGTSLVSGATSGAGMAASGVGSSASMGTTGMSMLGSMSSLMNSLSPAVSGLGNHIPFLGSALGSGVSPASTSMVSTAGMGNAAVSASVGRASTLGVLSVPQNWATAAPAFSQVGSVAPSASVGAGGATPAVAASAANPGGMFPPPLANLAARQAGAPLGSSARFDVRPTVVQRPVAAG